MGGEVNRFTFDLTSIFREESDHEIDDHFHRQIQFSLANGITAIVIATILWSFVTPKWLLTWLSLVFLVSTFRVLLVYFYEEKEQPVRDVESWHIAVLVLILLMGIIWGSLVYIYDPNWPVLQQASVVCVLAVVVFGAIPAYAAVMQVYIISLIAILSPFAAVYLYSNHDDFLFNGSVLLILSTVLVILAKLYHRLLANGVAETPDNICFIDVNGSMEDKVVQNNSQASLLKSDVDELLPAQIMAIDEGSDIVAKLNIDPTNIMQARINPKVGSGRHFTYTDIAPDGQTSICLECLQNSVRNRTGS